MKYIIAAIFTMSLFELKAEHIIPESIEDEVNKALSYYPQLEKTTITFKFKKEIKKATMQARPTFGSLFRSKKNRKYVVLISERVKISDTLYRTKDLPPDVLVGWIGHELGHIEDYRKRSNLNLLGFGWQYLFSDKHIIEAERTADRFAVMHGMEKYILKTKDFILNTTQISPVYVERVKKFYLSPDDIISLVRERDEKEKIENDLLESKI